MKLFKLFFTITSLLVIISCGSKKAVTQAEVVDENPRPQWVTQRPMNSFNYIGIGISNKQRNPTDFQEIAKRNALNDLASEISVQITSNSLLFQIERDNNFREDFKNTVQTSSSTKITDFEVAGTWENDQEYWVYYRLNRETYRQQKEREKQQAGQRALSFYLSAQEAEKNNINLAINNYLKSLDALKDFWNETLEIEHDGKKVLLAVDAYQALQQLISGIQMQLNKDIVELNINNAFTFDIQGAVNYQGLPVTSFPVNISFPGQNGTVRGVLNTNNTGVYTFQIAKVNKERNNPLVEISYRVDEMLDPNLDKKMSLAFLSQLVNWRKMVPVRVEPPLVHILSIEKNLGSKRSSESLKNYIQNELNRKGVQFTEKKSAADVIITINGDTKEIGTSGDFYTTALDVTIKAVNSKNGISIFSESLTNIRGVQLDHERAGEVAYQRAEQDLKRGSLNKLSDALF